MSAFPSGVYDPREVENLPGITYDPAETKNLFAEDVNLANDEIVAIEETLGVNPQGSYDTVRDWLDALEAGGGGGSGDMLKAVYDPQGSDYISGATGSGGAAGGTLILDGGTGTGALGGTIEMTGGSGTDASAGYIRMNGGTGVGADGAGGYLITENGGGGIDTTGQGLIQLGNHGSRTTLYGAASSANQDIYFPNASGTLLLSNGDGAGLTNLDPWHIQGIPNNPTRFLDGQGGWTVPSVGSVAWGDVTGTLTDQTDLFGTFEEQANLDTDVGALGYIKTTTGYTGPLNDSTSTQIADVVDGLITGVYF